MWSRIKAGDTLYEVRSERMGHTTLRTVAVRECLVESIDHEAGTAMVRWNIVNPARPWTRRRVEKLRVRKPITVTRASGARSIAPRRTAR